MRWPKGRGHAPAMPEEQLTAAADPNPETTEFGDHQDAVAGGWPSRSPIVIGDPGPEFEARVPATDYRRTLYRADTVIDGWSNGPFTLRAASLRGHLHRYNGVPRQDDYAAVLATDGARLIVAVADGVSAAALSHLGSSAVVRYATQWLDEQARVPLAELEWKTLFENTAWALTEFAASTLGLADPDGAQTEAAFATTLTCAVCESAGDGSLSAVVSGVGDSGAWLLADGEFTAVVGGKTEEAESGLTSSAVSGLPRVPDEVRPVALSVPAGAVLLIGTDGFGDPLGDGDGDVGGLFQRLLGESVPARLEFAHALDFSRVTFDDDRTLVAVWPAPEATG